MKSRALMLMAALTFALALGRAAAVETPTSIASSIEQTSQKTEAATSHSRDNPARGAGIMDSTALISGLIGAMIGSLTSLSTLIVQNIFQNRRESKKLLFETAFKDYELRIMHLPENRAAFPVILAYHQKMIELIEGNRLTPSAAKEILRMQSEMGAALQRAITDLDPPEKAHRETQT